MPGRCARLIEYQTVCEAGASCYCMSTEAVIRALGWALVHSLWQGALLALLYRVVRKSLRGPVLRYRIAFAAMCLQFLLAVLTFAWCYEPVLRPDGIWIIRCRLAHAP